MSDHRSHDATPPRWPATWVRAILPLAILVSLEERPLHGYAIAQSLGELGFGVPKGGSLYPALARLEEAGEVEAQWVPGPSGPARREYTLTASGRDHLAVQRTQLSALTAELTRATGTSSPAAAPMAQHSSTIGGPDDACR
ncbi:PadR family transcriptional regulator [Brachybacterium halotolerans subsp. kimchii]|uniref:PadR family transcriptional regulator n=1 Tax=Brachybacterium halotolerans TaxID=2795215 RepID=UPI001E5B57F9|nr:PadR family transcriptional regulator [Brachybacterium halotolerans]UEJ84268.1 PadR family transcriptional regulator [Brachybacterium halotolerans subsp. kimchii]